MQSPPLSSDPNAQPPSTQLVSDFKTSAADNVNLRRYMIWVRGGVHWTAGLCRGRPATQPAGAWPYRGLPAR